MPREGNHAHTGSLARAGNDDIGHGQAGADHKHRLAIAQPQRLAPWIGYIGARCRELFTARERRGRVIAVGDHHGIGAQLLPAGQFNPKARAAGAALDTGNAANDSNQARAGGRLAFGLPQTLFQVVAIQAARNEVLGRRARQFHVEKIQERVRFRGFRGHVAGRHIQQERLLVRRVGDAAAVTNAINQRDVHRHRRCVVQQLHGDGSAAETPACNDNGSWRLDHGVFRVANSPWHCGNDPVTFARLGW